MSLTVEDILIRYGHPEGVRGRTTCPIHGGTNEHSFSYREGVWHCWACGAGGGIKKLLDHFNPLVVVEGLETALGDLAGGGPLPYPSLGGLRPSRWLLARSQAQEQAFLEAALDLHQRALREMDREIPWVLRHGGPETFEMAAEAWRGATYRLWMAEEILGCSCS